MNKAREHMEGVVALVLMAYAIALLLEEEVRDRVYGARGGVRFILEPSCC
jgi:drug/metabolite transporter superfamily protein YnfA